MFSELMRTVKVIISVVNIFMYRESYILIIQCVNGSLIYS